MSVSQPPLVSHCAALQSYYLLPESNLGQKSNEVLQLILAIVYLSSGVLAVVHTLAANSENCLD